MDPTTLTLRAWYERFEPMYLAGSKPATFHEYHTSVNKWEALTANPTLASIDTMVLGAWKIQMLDSGLAKPTINKHLRHVQHLLNKAGPAGPRNRDALGLLPSAAWTKPLKTLQPLPPYLTPRQLNTLYRACGFATQPNTGVSPEAWWQCLIVLTYNLALRRGAVLALRWADVDLKAALLHVPAAIDKRGVERLKPLNSTCIKHLLRLRSTEKNVFHFPHGRTKWYMQWRLLAAAAAQTAQTTIVQTQFDFEATKQEQPETARIGLNIRCVQPATVHFHDLKRTSATVWAGHASPWAVRYMLDHGPGDVTGLYIDPTNELREKCETLPQPSSFLGELGEGETRDGHDTFARR